MMKRKVKGVSFVMKSTINRHFFFKNIRTFYAGHKKHRTFQLNETLNDGPLK